MASSALPLEELTPRTLDELAPETVSKDTWGEELGNQWQGFKASAYGVASGVAGALDLATHNPLGKEPEPVNQAIIGARRWLDTKQQEAIEGLTPQGKKNAAASFTSKEGSGNDIFDPDVSMKSAITSAVVSGIPSVVSSILATVAGSALGGPVGAFAGSRLSGASMDAGSTWNTIRDEIDKATPEELAQKSDLYRGLRDMGLSDYESRSWMIDEAGKYKALLVGAFSGLTSGFGAEGFAARALGGARTAGSRIASIGKAGLGEAGEEFAQQFFQSVQEQRGKNEARGEADKAIDWHDALDEAVKAAVGGFGIGGATGAVFHRRGAEATAEPAQARVDTTASPVGATENAALRPPQTVNDQVDEVLNARPTPQAPPTPVQPTPVADPDIEAALSPQPTAPEPTAAQPGTTQPAAPEPTGRVAANIDPTLGEEPVDEEPVVSAGSPPPLPIAPILDPRMQQAIGAAPETALPSGVSARGLTPEDEAIDAANINRGRAPTEVTNVPEPVAGGAGVRAAPTAVGAPNVSPAVAPGAARVLEDVAAKKRERKGERLTPAKQAQLDAGETEVLPKREHEKRERQRSYAATAERVRAALAEVPHPGENADLKTMRTYVRALTERAGVDAKTPLPRTGEDIDPALALVKTARSLTAGSREKLNEYLTTDLAFRGGAENQAVETRRAQAAKSEASLDQSMEAPADAPPGATTAERTSAAVAERDRTENELLGTVDEQRAAKRRAELETELARRKELRQREAKVAAEEAAKEAVAAVERKPSRAVVVERIEAGKRRKLTPPGPRPVTPRTEAEGTEQLQAQREQEEAASPTVRDNAALPSGFVAARERAARGKFMLRGPAGSVEVDRPTTFDEALADVRVERLSRLHRNAVNFFQAQISPLIEGSTKVHLVSDAQYFALRGDRKSRAYHHAGTIVINRDVSDTDARLAHDLIHEGSHGALENAIETNPVAKHQIDMLRDEMQTYLRRVSPALADEYGFKDAHEFIAEIMSNPTFQRMAAEIPAPPALLTDMGFDARRPASMWQAFVSLVRRIFGADPNKITVLDVALRHTENLFEAANRMEGKVFPLTVRDMGVQGAKDAYSDVREAMSLGMRGAGIRIAPFHHIVTQFDKLFKDRPLDKIERALDKAYMRSQALVEEATPHITAWLELSRKNAQEAVKAARAVTEITMGNMNPIDKVATKAELLKANPHFGDIKSDRATLYAKRGQLERLNNELWMGLQPETRAIIRKAATYFKDAHNERTRMFLRKVLDMAKPEVRQNSQALQAIITNTMTGKLTEDDRAHINDDNLFKVLQNAQEFRQIEGMYFPLLRHGSHVVTTLDKIGNLHGGKLEGKDIVEFRAATDKDARAAYRRFMEDPANRDVVQHTTAAKRRYMGDKIITATDAAGQTHDVAYRVRIQRTGMYMFPSARAAAAFRREHGGSFDEVSRVMKKDEADRTGDLASRDITALQNLIDRRTDIAEGTRNLLKSLTREVSVMQLAGNRIQQRQLPRRNVKGASQDIALNIMTYAQASANAVARFENMDTLRAALDDMHSQVQSRSNDQPAQLQLIKEVNYRFLDPSLNPKAPPQFVRTSMTLSYLARLFSPAYSIVNATQPWTTTLYRLGGEYGFMRTGAAINRAYNDISGFKQIGSGVFNTARAANPRTFFDLKINTTDVLGSIRKNLAGDAGALAALDNAIERGKIDPDAGQEIEHASIIGKGRGGKLLASVDRIMRQLPQAVEALNRASTIVAAYRLAKAAGATHAEAVDKAFDTMMETQGDYSVRNTPKAFFQNPWLAPAIQFKKYALMQGALMQDMLKRAGGATATPAERKTAFKQIAGMITIQMLVAGSSGLPGLEFIKIPLMVAGILGVGGGYDEWARKVRKYMDEAIGKGPAELLSSGILSRAIGIDLSGKMSLSDMLVFGEPKQYDNDGVLAYIAQMFLGSPGGMLLEWQRGIEAAGNGEWAKAFSLMLPIKFAQDTAKAIHKYQKGDINIPEALGQTLGFRSGRMAEAGAETGDRIKTGQKAEKASKRLKSRYIEADKSELPAIRKEIEAHNKQTFTDANGKEYPLPRRLQVYPKALDAARISKNVQRKAIQGE